MGFAGLGTRKECSTLRVDTGIPKLRLGTMKNPFLYTIPVVMIFFNRFDTSAIFQLYHKHQTMLNDN